MQDGNMSPVSRFIHNKWVRLVGIIDIIIVVIIIVAVIINARKTSVLVLNVVPVDAQISVNGDTNYSANGQYRLAPGVYEVEISHPDLDSKNFTVDLEHRDVASVITFLSKDGEFDYYKLRANLGDYTALTEIAAAGYNTTTDNDTSAESFIAEFQYDYDLYSTKLPVTYSEHDDKGHLSKYIAVREDKNCELTLCLIVAIFSEDDKEKVIRSLKENGFNVEDYEIKYKYY